jgi:hypothetical protein
MSEENFLDLNALTAETIKGTQSDSVYMVFAKADGLKLAIRPLIFPAPYDHEDTKIGMLYLGARLRVVAESPDASILTAESSFGIAGFTDKGEHASQVIGVPLAVLPCGIAEARTRWLGDNLSEAMVGTLYGQLETVGATPTAPKSQVEEWLYTEYNQCLPQGPDVKYLDKVQFGIKI